eukprot:jgi/Botrbrau1/10157/Bobra.0121s0009.1
MMANRRAINCCVLWGVTICPNLACGHLSRPCVTEQEGKEKHFGWPPKK